MYVCDMIFVLLLGMLGVRAWKLGCMLLSKTLNPRNPRNPRNPTNPKKPKKLKKPNKPKKKQKHKKPKKPKKPKNPKTLNPPSGSECLEVLCLERLKRGWGLGYEVYRDVYVGENVLVRLLGDYEWASAVKDCVS